MFILLTINCKLEISLYKIWKTGFFFLPSLLSSSKNILEMEFMFEDSVPSFFAKNIK